MRELGDGRVLVHCFAGCAADEIVNAAGLTLADLMPARALGDHAPPDRSAWHARDVLALVAREARLVAVAAAGLARGIALTDGDRRRLLVAAERILDAVALAGGGA